MSERATIGNEHQHAYIHRTSALAAMHVINDLHQLRRPKHNVTNLKNLLTTVVGMM